MKHLSPLLILAGLVTCTGAVAQAEDTDAMGSSVTVHFADLDVNTTAGAAALYHRLNDAAATVCRELAPDRSLVAVMLHSHCMQRAVSAAVVTVDRPALTAYAAAHGRIIAAKPVRVARRS